MLVTKLTILTLLTLSVLSDPRDITTHATPMPMPVHENHMSLRTNFTEGSERELDLHMVIENLLELATMPTYEACQEGDYRCDFDFKLKELRFDMAEFAKYLLTASNETHRLLKASSIKNLILMSIMLKNRNYFHIVHNLLEKISKEWIRHEDGDENPRCGVFCLLNTAIFFYKNGYVEKHGDFYAQMYSEQFYDVLETQFDFAATAMREANAVGPNWGEAKKVLETLEDRNEGLLSYTCEKLREVDLKNLAPEDWPSLLGDVNFDGKADTDDLEKIVDSLCRPRD